MQTSAIDRDSFPPRMALLLPIVLLLHQVEEWFGGFPEWTSFVLGNGNGVEPEQFLLVNAVGFVLFTFLTLAAFREPGMAWIVVSMAALLGLNGVLHAVASILVGRYSPGTLTGLLLSLPFCVIVLRSGLARMPKVQVFAAIVAAVVFHGGVTFFALA
ncbi:MAG: HXXEE domain-containing protein [Anaerolineae bacterium]|nr:HXXEE domain-containing protein [Anaerolineae bacterium]